MRRPPILLASALLGLALLSGCGGSKSSTTPTTQTSSAAVVKTAGAGNLGTILVAGNGRTLYLFAADKGKVSTCYGGCASAWPPLTTSTKAQSGGSAMSAQLGTSKRTDNTVQVTYAGHPLYYFAGDGSPGDVKGQGLNIHGGRWWVLSASGKQIVSAAGSGSGSTSGGSGRGGY